ncbi:MAG: ATP synthase F1 subunit gamma [Planctomycetaceae bacterium]|nr:ATP synthase F1 subunit gamma [Planctomycetaceae bacterium]
MAKSREILKRRRAVGNIRTVTRAMEMVASSRYSKAHARALASQPHTAALVQLVSDVADSGGFEGEQHPLLTHNKGVSLRALLVIASSRGLCGPYNNLVLREAMRCYRRMQEQGQVELHVVGRRGVNHFRAVGITIDRVHPDLGDFPEYAQVGRLAEQFMNQYRQGRIAGLEVAFMQYHSAARQRAMCIQLLPMTEHPQGAASPKKHDAYEFTPSREEVVRHLLPATLRMQMYQCFLDAAVSEQISRMRAMRNAVENADEMLHQLTVRYNRARQQQITTELAEIIGGRMGLENAEV